MDIYPAIDIINRQVVRLTRGDYDRVAVYDDRPVETALGFEACGATHLHVVDLDGAKDGTLSNFDVIRDIVAATNLFVEVGGGIRDEARICRYLEAGVGRVILGSVALENPAFLTDMLAKYGHRLAVGVDARDGYVAIHGWRTLTDTPAIEFCRRLAELGVSDVIYTDIARDGAMQGTNLEVYRTLASLPLRITASGGITYYDELEALCRMGISAAILGKSLYTGVLDLKTALERVRDCHVS
ncbi:MAG: 1-(5-phosphoribosyl)-5-[(5-phosphoribosylamino)methylideneamino]imidazole-4-carboxamide isomerase [Eubacteriales bacterium]